jgi:hypothetical protein
MSYTTHTLPFGFGAEFESGSRCPTRGRSVALSAVLGVGRSEATGSKLL